MNFLLQTADQQGEIRAVQGGDDTADQPGPLLFFPLRDQAVDEITFAFLGDETFFVQDAEQGKSGFQRNVFPGGELAHRQEFFTDISIGSVVEFRGHIRNKLIDFRHRYTFVIVRLAITRIT